MTGPNLPPRIGPFEVRQAEQTRDMLRRLDELEKARPAVATDQIGGSYTVRDETGTVRLIVGQFPDPFNPTQTSFGFLVINASGVPVFSVSEAGIAIPGTAGIIRNTTEFISVASGAGDTFTFQACFPVLTAKAFNFEAGISVPPSTTVNAYLQANWGPPHVSATQSHTSGGSTDSWNPIWNWSLPDAVINAEGALIALVVNVTGTGPASVFPPYAALNADPDAIGATATGI